MARLDWWKGAEKHLCGVYVSAQGFRAVLMCEVVFGVINECGCPKKDMGVAVFYDVGYGKAFAACACGIVPGQWPEFV